MLRNFHKTKRGVASLYAVIFATILFGVITLSFIRIILSEARQSGDDELSQSAYDSALAGIEDTKRAVNKYYKCLNDGGSPSSCGELFVNTSTCDDFDKTDSHLKTLMGFEGTQGEVKIQEESTTSGTTTETSTDQAYTCIILSDETLDYRSTLSSDTRVRVVPLGINNNTGSKLGEVRKIEFKWFSENNGTTLTNLYANKAMKNKNDTSNIPVISLTLLYTGATFNISDFNNSTGENYDTMILLPSEPSADGATNEIGWTSIEDAGNSNATNKQGNADGSTRNTPFSINCAPAEFACSVTLGTDASKLALPANGNALLIVSMPYDSTIADFSVAMKGDGGKTIPFKGAQISVDSTGRANQLYRRVEARLDPVDSYFPYPQYALELDGNADSKLLKNFWITYNCWTEGGPCPNNGDLTP